MEFGLVWTVLKTAAAKIPWGRVAQNAPLIVDALGRVKAKAREDEAVQKDLQDHLKVLQQENAKLTSEMHLMANNLQALTSRVTLLTNIAGAALLLSLAAAILWLLK